MTELRAEVSRIVATCAPNATVDVESTPSIAPKSLGAAAPSAQLVTIRFPEDASTEDICNALDEINRQSPKGYQVMGRTNVTITLDRG